MVKLRRFWFKFETLNEPTPLNLGCGVTAFNREDAQILVNLRVFKNQEVPEVQQIIDDVDFEMLDQRHVAPNIGDMFVRGVWFPLGY
jgi:hypothetical protein